MKNSYFLILILLIPIASADSFLKQTLTEGEDTIIDVNGGYHITLQMVADEKRVARFIVNGEKTDLLADGEDYRFEDGSRILVRDVLVQEGGDDLVQYNFYSAGEGLPIAEVEPQEEEVVEEPGDEISISPEEPQSLPEVDDEVLVAQEHGEAEVKKESTIKSFFKKLWNAFKSAFIKSE